MVAEAPLALDGYIAWDQATHWHFEEGSHRLLAKQLPSGEMLAIVSDHLGTPKEMFDAQGTLLWAADHHVWGAIRTTRTFGPLAALPKHDRPPEDLHCPWRFPGQYEDTETGLCYNRHRHYDPLTGQYASPDPIGLTGGDRPQGYVFNPLSWIDPSGLRSGPSGHALAGSVDEGGSGRAFTGHGAYFPSQGTMIVPEGTPITVWARHGQSISDYAGKLIEKGEYDKVMQLMNANHPAANGLAPRTYLPGTEMPNYTLYPPDQNINLMSNSTSVASPTPLSNLVTPNMGCMDWAVCANVFPGR